MDLDKIKSVKSSSIEKFSMIKMENFLVCFAKVAPKHPKIKSLMDPRKTLFKNPKSNLESTIDLETALSKASEINKHIDLLGNNNVEDTYEPLYLLSTLGDDFKKLPCVMDEEFLTIDFGSNVDKNKNEIGVRSFKLTAPNKDQEKNDMIRRSRD